MLKQSGGVGPSARLHCPLQSVVLKAEGGKGMTSNVITRWIPISSSSPSNCNWAWKLLPMVANQRDGVGKDWGISTRNRKSRPKGTIGQAGTKIAIGGGKAFLQANGRGPTRVAKKCVVHEFTGNTIRLAGIVDEFTFVTDCLAD
jgi:hypothetical protein